MKIKGWKRIDTIFREGVQGAVYVSDKNRTIVVAKSVVIDDEKSIPKFETKEKAFNYATDYMRKHPRG